MLTVLGVHHIGIRIVDEARSVAFYGLFGFRVVYRDAHDPVVILQNDAGVELNLVVNGETGFDGNNRLMDVPEKYPGYTHVALRVASIEQTATALRLHHIRITEGPRKLGAGVSLFLRDPDANVIELREDSVEE